MPLTRLLHRWTWRSPADRWWSFAHAEAASELDLRLAANATTDPARAAAYLRHAADEARHARMFAAAARAGRPELGPLRADADRFYEQLGEVGFLAFLHLGERRGRRRFEAWRDRFRADGDERSAAILDAVVPDELRHETYSRELLVALVGEDGARRALLRASAWEAWRARRRAGRGLATAIWLVLVVPLYAALAPLSLLAPRARSGWRDAPPSAR